MDQLSNFISEYLKTCETIKKLNSKTIKAYRIDLLLMATLDGNTKTLLPVSELPCILSLIQ